MVDFTSVLNAATPVTNTVDSVVDVLRRGADTKPERAGDIVEAQDTLRDVQAKRRNPMWYRMLNAVVPGAIVGGLGLGAKAGTLLAGEDSLGRGVMGGASLGALIGGGAAGAHELFDRATEGARMRKAKRTLQKAPAYLMKRLGDQDVEDEAREYQTARDYPLRLGEMGMLAGGLGGAAYGMHHATPAADDKSVQVFGVEGPARSKVDNAAKWGLYGTAAAGLAGVLGGLWWRHHKRKQLVETLTKTSAHMDYHRMLKRQQERRDPDGILAARERAKWKPLDPKTIEENSWPATNVPALTMPTGGNPMTASNRSLLRGFATTPERFSMGKMAKSAVQLALESLTSVTSTSLEPAQIAAAVLKTAEITLDIDVGDWLLGGRFKNHPVKVEDIGTDDLGQPTVNGRKLLAYRIQKKMPKDAAAAPNLRSRSETIAYDETGVLALPKDDYLGFPGGGIDDGEDAECAAYREAIEEADRKLLHLKSVSVQDVVWPEGEALVDGFDGFHNYVFVAIDGGKLGTKHEDNEDYRIIPFAEALKHLHGFKERKDLKWRLPMIDAEIAAVEEAQKLAEGGFVTATKIAEKTASARHGFLDIREGRSRVSVTSGTPLIAVRDPEAFAKRRAQVAADEVDPLSNERVEKKAAEAAHILLTVMDDQEPDRTDKSPAILVDLDHTIRDWHEEGKYTRLGSQFILSRRKEILKQLRELGFKVIGVTNHTLHNDDKHKGLTLDTLGQIQHETIGLMDGLLDDICYLSAPDPDLLKPSSAMIDHVIKRYGLDPAKTVMVGDNVDHDGGAAREAEIPFVEAEKFFADASTTVDSVKALIGGIEKKADALNLLPRSEYMMLNDAGQVYAAPDENRRYRFPGAGAGKPAPYEPSLRFAPPTGVPEPGAHGYEYQFHVGEGGAPELAGGAWTDPQAVLKDLYASMGKKENAPYRDLDRARARVLVRALKARAKKAPVVAPLAPPVQPIQP